MRSLLVSIAFFLAAAPAFAEDFPLLEGLGTTTCAQFADKYRKNQAVEHEYYSWAQGFLSAFNMARFVTGHTGLDLKKLSYTEKQGRIRDFCDAHPLATYMAAVQTLITELQGG